MEYFFCEQKAHLDSDVRYNESIGVLKALPQLGLKPKPEKIKSSFLLTQLFLCCSEDRDGEIEEGKEVFFLSLTSLCYLECTTAASQACQPGSAGNAEETEIELPPFL